MVHLIYDGSVYINIEQATKITVNNVTNSVVLTTGSHEYVLSVCEHPKVKELLSTSSAEEQDKIKKQVCYKVLEAIIERLAQTDEKLPPIFNLEAGLATIQKVDNNEERKPADVIPVTVDKDGNITKVIEEKN